MAVERKTPPPQERQAGPGRSIRRDPRGDHRRRATSPGGSAPQARTCADTRPSAPGIGGPSGTGSPPCARPGGSRLRSPARARRPTPTTSPAASRSRAGTTTARVSRCSGSPTRNGGRADDRLSSLRRDRLDDDALLAALDGRRRHVARDRLRPAPPARARGRASDRAAPRRRARAPGDPHAVSRTSRPFRTATTRTSP